MENTIKTLIWKEALVFSKQSSMLILMTWGGITFVIMKMINTMSTINQLNGSTVSSYLLMYVAENMLMTYGLQFAVSMKSDIQEGTLNPVLASVNKASLIWLGQYLFATLISIATTMIGLIAIFIEMYVVLSSTVEPEMESYILWLIIAPSLAMAFSALNLFCAWVIRYQGLIMITSFMIPCGAYMLIMKYSDMIINIDMNIVFVSLLVAVCIAIMVLLVKLIDIIPKENYVGKI